MKKFVSGFLLTIGLIYVSAQSGQPITVSEKEVPKAVLKKFNEKRPNATDVKWHPYPNQYTKAVRPSLSYYPIGWTNYTQDYYEVRFMDTKGVGREVYDRAGGWKVTSRMIDGVLPSEVSAQMSNLGYDTWTKVNQELVSRSGHTSKFYKVWLTKDNKRRILFFNESYELVKTLRWDNDTKLIVNENTKTDPAVGVKKNRKIVEASNVPVAVKNKAKKNHVDVEVIEWFSYTRIYDPFASDASGFSYYDISTPAFYQVIFTDKSGKFMASYSTSGELIEIATILKTKMLPKPIRKTIQSEGYDTWKWEDEHEEILINDQRIYRVYGAQNDTPSVVIFNDKGVAKAN